MTNWSKSFMPLLALLWCSSALGQDDLYVPSPKSSDAPPVERTVPKKSAPKKSAPSVSLTGTWTLKVDCPALGYTNTLTIFEATSSSVIGTTRTLTGTGQIASGTFNGSDAQFLDTYVRNKEPHSTRWKAHLTSNDTMAGSAYGDDLLTSEGCTFVGSRK